VPPSYGRTHEAVSEIPEIAGVNAYASIVPRRASLLLPSPCDMAEQREHTVKGLDEEERVIAAALKAVREKKVKLREEAEEKWRAEEAEVKCIADEAEEKRKADEGEVQRLAEEAKEARKDKEAAEKERAAKA
jgi:hypothetical protein